MRHFACCGRSLVICSLLLSGTALAQTEREQRDENSVTEVSESSADESNAELETITVKGEKVGRSLQDTQTSAVVYDQERLERELTFDLDDVFLRVPNVNASAFTSSVAIRGINRNGVGAAGTGVTSNIFVDGAPLATFGLSFGLQSLWDIERVEILRGPQSTVQGRNSLAGAIYIETNDPTFFWETAGRVRVAELGNRQYSAVVSGPLIDDDLAFRLAVDYQQNDGQVNNAITGRNADFEDALTFNGKLLFNPSSLPDLRAELTVNVADSDRGDVTLNPPAPFGSDEFNAWDPFNSPDFGASQNNETDVLRLVSDISYALNDTFTLRNITTFEDVDRNRVLGRPDNLTVFEDNGINDDKVETLSSELRLNFVSDRWSGVAGLYYFDEEIDTDFNILTNLQRQVQFPINPPESVVDALLLSSTKTENYAIFAEAQFDINRHWSLSFGARYDHEEFETTGTQSELSVDPASCLATIPQPTPDGVIFIDVPCQALLPSSSEPAQSNDFDVFAPRGSLIYRFNDDRSLAFSVQRGFRAGGTFITGSPETGEVTVGQFDPEFLLNYELAFRSQWFDRRLTVNANVFYSDWSDQQVSIPGPSGTTFDARIVNAGKSELYGAELSIDAILGDGLTGFFSVGYLQTEFTDFPFGIINLRDNEFPNSPEFSLSTGFSYEFAERWFIDANLNHSDGQFSDVENLLVNQVGAFTIVNARAGYRHDHFTIYAFANNLLDENYLTRANFQSIVPSTGEINTLDPGSVNLGAPRVAGVALEFGF
jgi:iron complex outermembrane recepter protein